MASGLGIPQYSSAYRELQMPQGKWEMNEDKKRRLIEYPEIHPALDSRVPQFSFVDGRIPEPPSKNFIKKIKERGYL